MFLFIIVSTIKVVYSSIKLAHGQQCEVKELVVYFTPYVCNSRFISVERRIRPFLRKRPTCTIFWKPSVFEDYVLFLHKTHRRIYSARPGNVATETNILASFSFSHVINSFFLFFTFYFLL